MRFYRGIFLLYLIFQCLVLYFSLRIYVVAGDDVRPLLFGAFGDESVGKLITLLFVFLFALHSGMTLYSTMNVKRTPDFSVAGRLIPTLPVIALAVAFILLFATFTPDPANPEAFGWLRFIEQIGAVLVGLFWRVDAQALAALCLLALAYAIATNLVVSALAMATGSASGPFDEDVGHQAFWMHLSLIAIATGYYLILLKTYAREPNDFVNTFSAPFTILFAIFVIVLMAGPTIRFKFYRKVNIVATALSGIAVPNLVRSAFDFLEARQLIWPALIAFWRDQI